MIGCARIFLVALACVGTTGCDQLFDRDRSKAPIAAAEKKASAGDFRGAIKLYESALDGTPKTADVHFKLGVIYDDKLKSPRDALHHFERYLDFAPTGSHAKEARTYKKEDEFKILASLTRGGFVSQEDAVKIKNENASLRKTIELMRVQKNATPPPGVAKGEQVQKPIPPGARTHVVKSGETLATLAAKYYRNKTRWKDIQDANFYSLQGTAKIKAGQTLIIPK